MSRHAARVRSGSGGKSLYDEVTRFSSEIAAGDLARALRRLYRTGRFLAPEVQGAGISVSFGQWP
jgi:hypothetical protein